MELPDSYVIECLNDFDGFFSTVQREGHDIIKHVLNKQWYDSMRIDAEMVWRGRIEDYPGQFFPYRWLYEDEHWNRINLGIAKLEQLTAKPAILKQKFKAAASSDWPANECAAFEMDVLSHFVHDGTLVDIEARISNASGNKVDGVIQPCSRRILVEATKITRNLVHPKVRSGNMSVQEQVYQIVSKCNAKAKHQLNLASGPTILAIAVPSRGVNQISAVWGLRDVFPGASAIGAAIISDTYRFVGNRWYVNPCSDNPLTEREIAYLRKSLGAEADLHQ